MDQQLPRHPTRRQPVSQVLAERILAMIRSGTFHEGDHLRAQDLADRLHASRFPVGEALKLLADRKVVTHEPHRGFFVASVSALGDLADRVDDPLEAAYRHIAEDHLQNKLPERVSAVFLKERYGMTQSQLSDLLSRIVGEGWAQRRAGSGWTFLAMLRTPEALQQTYRVRQAIEPAALLEPTFHMPQADLEACKAAEEALLAGAVETLSAEQLYQVGVNFHETVMSASHNPFFLETLRRVNQARRLIAYRAMVDRRRYYDQAREHLAILRHIENGDLEKASDAMRLHLGHVVRDLTGMKEVLERPSEDDRESVA